MTIDGSIRTEAVAAVDRYYAALNAHDEEGVRDAFHYPHVRIGATGKVTIYPTREDYRFAFFYDRTSKDGWHHSAWDAAEVVFATPDKAHIAIDFTRYRQDGSVIGRYFSLYVITRRDGKWAIQAGSGNGS